MTGGYFGTGLKKIPGRKRISDDEAIALLKDGWFFRQIIAKYKIALPRLEE